MNAFRSPTGRRVVFAVICLLIVLTGAGNLLKGHLDYRNYKGFYVFAPFAVLVGCLGLVLAIWRPKLFADQAKRRGRVGTRPTGPSHRSRKRR
jgi:hypothetical protein